MPLKCYCTKAEKYDAVQTENNPYPTVIFSFPAEACNCVYVTQNVYFIIRIFMIFFLKCYISEDHSIKHCPQYLRVSTDTFFPQDLPPHNIHYNGFTIPIV